MADNSINSNDAVTATQQAIAIPKEIQVEVVEDFEPLASMQPQWDAFMEVAGGEIYLTYDWCRIWWKYYGGNRKLKIFLFRHQSELVGILPLMFDKIWLGPVSVRVGKIVGTDFGLTTASVPILKEFIDDVIRHLSEIICKYRLDIIHIGPISGMYADFDPLRAACERYFAPCSDVKAVESNVQAYMRLPSTWEEYLSELKKSRRNSIKKNYKIIDAIKAAKGADLSAEFATEETADNFFNEFVQMHQSHWQKLGKLGHFGDWPRSEMFHRELAAILSKHKRLRLLKVEIGEDTLAYTYNYLFGATYYGLLTARSDLQEYTHIGIGDVILAKEVKIACRDNARFFDLMQGKYEHKISQGAQYYPVRNLFICDRRPMVRLRTWAFCGLAKLLNIGYYKIWFCRLAPKLPFKRKPLWKIWIRTRGLA